MCILFIHTGGKFARGYRLILASNRDEFFKRPAVRAAPWKENENIIGGRDMEPGREGGTWLAISRKGRIASLLNLPTVPMPINTQARGSIVSNFMLKDISSDDYIKKLEESGDKYTPFNLITVDIGDTSSTVDFYSNYDKKKITYQTGAVSFSNCIPDKPLKKAVDGLKRFEDIIKDHSEKARDKESLVNDLLNFLKWDKRHLPDPVLEKRPYSHDGLSSVFVNLPEQDYGTRTHTIILVDADGNIDFWEWDKISSESDWSKVHIQQKLISKL